MDPHYRQHPDREVDQIGAYVKEHPSPFSDPCWCPGDRPDGEHSPPPPIMLCEETKCCICCPLKHKAAEDAAKMCLLGLGAVAESELY